MSRYYLQVEGDLLRLHEAATGDPAPDIQVMGWDEATRLCLALNETAHEEALRRGRAVQWNVLPPTEPITCPNCARYQATLDKIIRFVDAVANKEK